MKYIDEYRDQNAAQKYLSAIKKITTQPWTIMEICGGQTHAIVRYGIEDLLPDEITLVHGPGCPVCVTPIEKIDKALAIAARENVIFCSFGDMLRVPSTSKDRTSKDLLSVRAEGGNVQIVYSPLDAVQIARDNPDKDVVFFAVGFETTAPANAMAVFQAKEMGLKNFFLLVSHVLVPPAMESILSNPECRVQGFLAAGHVCAVMGLKAYEPIAARYKVPIVATGFEPLDILQGLYMCIKQLEENRYQVENQYARAVAEQGNRPAQELLSKVFQIIPRQWRGIGEIPQSGRALSNEYAAFDAERHFVMEDISVYEDDLCISGSIMQGLKKPAQCPQFGKGCTPDHPLGAPMVSTEGACAAYFKYSVAK